MTTLDEMIQKAKLEYEQAKARYVELVKIKREIEENKNEIHKNSDRSGL